MRVTKVYLHDWEVFVFPESIYDSLVEWFPQRRDIVGNYNTISWNSIKRFSLEIPTEIDILMLHNPWTLEFNHEISIIRKQKPNCTDDYVARQLSQKLKDILQPLPKNL